MAKGLADKPMEQGCHLRYYDQMPLSWILTNMFSWLRMSEEGYVANLSLTAFLPLS